MSSALDTAHSVLSSVLKLFMQQRERGAEGARGPRIGWQFMQLPLDTVRHLAALQNYAKQFDFETKMAEKPVKPFGGSEAARQRGCNAISRQIMRRLRVPMLQLLLPLLQLLLLLLVPLAVLLLVLLLLFFCFNRKCCLQR